MAGYRNIIAANKIKDVLAGIGSADDLIKEQTIQPRYIRGYESQNFWENIFGDDALSSSENPELRSRFGQLFGFENKKIDTNDPYTTEFAKKEHFFKTIGGDDDRKAVGRILFPNIDEDVHNFRNILNAGEYVDNDSWAKYEDPILIGFEIEFNNNTPFFNGEIYKTVDNDASSSTPPLNSIRDFFVKYRNISEINNRYDWYKEFKRKLFTIFEKNTKNTNNIYKKPYFIYKVEGLNNLNKKIINYGEDKLTFTINEDVRMIAWYIAELYNNLVYSYRNKRMMFPENLLRFDMNIKLHEIRNFIMPKKEGEEITYEKSPRSTINFTLHDCSFNFFDSYNFGDDITMGGYDASMPPKSELQFNIIYKSVSKWSKFPLIPESDGVKSIIDPWNNNPEITYFENLERENNNLSGTTEAKSFWNKNLTTAGQTVANAGLNYVSNLETNLREERGRFIESTLQQFREWTTINKIEPDNVYSPEFTNKLNLNNFGRELASDLLNELENTTRNTTNF